MKKDGFTLVELLATIVLISLLLGLGIPGVMKISKNMKTRSFNTKISLIEKSGELWGQDNKSLLQNETCEIDSKTVNCYKITIKELIENDYLDSEDRNSIKFVNTIDDSDITSHVVYVYKKNNRVYAKYDKYQEVSSGENIITVNFEGTAYEQYQIIYGTSYTYNEENNTFALEGLKECTIGFSMSNDGYCLSEMDYNISGENAYILYSTISENKVDNFKTGDLPNVVEIYKVISIDHGLGEYNEGKGSLTYKIINEDNLSND